ncbi:MAG: Ig-like domain-containing protein [Acidobacteria bacterium]|nr:Ig-like domain-containing protein [Acidobacteriota bacterium]
MRRLLRTAGLFALLAALATAQTRPSGVFVSASEPRLVAGTTLQLGAVARATDGSGIDNATFTWTTSNPAVMTVNGSGEVTGVGLGIADITATYLGVRGTVRLQVLPARVEVTPGTVELAVGEGRALTAQALNSQGEAIPGVTFSWSAVGEDGFNNNGISVRNGQVFANATGRYMIRATFSYSAGPGQFAPSVSGQSIVTARPAKYYTTTRVLSSGDMREFAQLRAVRSTISANRKGQAMFVASLDGYSTGLVLLDAAGPTVVATSGVPGPLVGSAVVDFSEPILNDSGEAIVSVGSLGAARMLMLASRAGLTPLVFENSADTGFDVFNSVSYGPNAWGFGREKEFAFTATYRDSGATAARQGVFRYSFTGGLALEVSDQGPFPGLPGPYSFDNRTGIDDNGDLILQVAGGTGARAVYRKGASGTLTRLFGAGDPLRGVPIASLDSGGIIAGPGERLSFVARRTDGATFLLLVTKGDFAGARIWPLSNGGTVYGINRQGDVLGRLAPAAGEGVYRASAAGLQSVFAAGHPSPAGEVFQSFDWGGISDDGTVLVQARRPSTSFFIARAAGSNRSVAFESGVNVRVRYGPTFIGFIPEGKQGPAVVRMSNNRNAAMEVTPTGLTPVVTPGDRPTGGATLEGNYTVSRATSGDLLVGTDTALFQFRSRAPSVLSTFGRQFERGVIYAAYRYAGNAAGQLVTQHGTNYGIPAVLCAWENGQPKAIAYLGGSPQQTPSPAGGSFATLNDWVMDEQGRVLANMAVSGGPAGLFLWANGSWSAVALVGRSVVPDNVITSIGTIHSAGNRFLAVLRHNTNQQHIVDIEGATGIRVRLSSLDGAPQGNTYGSLSSFDSNARGDMVVHSSANGTQTVTYEPVSGPSRVVQAANTMTDSGEYVRFFSQVDLRDDGTIYFTGLNYLDQLVLYVAQPK